AAAHRPAGTGPWSGRCRWWGSGCGPSPPKCGPGAGAVANPEHVSFVALASELPARRTSGAPSGNLGLDVAGPRDHRRASLELAPGLDHAPVEILEKLGVAHTRHLAL